MKFKQYLKIIEQNTPGTHNDFATSSFLQSSWTGSESFPKNQGLPSLDLDIPEVVKNSSIFIIKNKENPIKIILKDGTKMLLSLDQYNRLNKKPEVNDNITVTFQRSNYDQSSNLSKIKNIIIH